MYTFFLPLSHLPLLSLALSLPVVYISLSRLSLISVSVSVSLSRLSLSLSGVLDSASDDVSAMCQTPVIRHQRYQRHIPLAPLTRSPWWYTVPGGNTVVNQTVCLGLVWYWIPYSNLRPQGDSPVRCKVDEIHPTFWERNRLFSVFGAWYNQKFSSHLA